MQTFISYLIYLQQLQQPNNSNAADGRKPLVLSSRLLAAADLSRYTAQSLVGAVLETCLYVKIELPTK